MDPVELPPTSSPTAYRTRTLLVGPVRFLVESNDPAVITRFEHLFTGFLTAPGLDGGRLTMVTVLNAALPGGATVGDRFASSVDDEPLLAYGDLGDHELAITRWLNDRKLDAEPGLLHLHSAAVARDGRAVVMAAMSGAGKSTLTAALLRAGWAYVTDEQVTIRPADGMLLAYPRPITVRRHVWPLFADVDEVPEQHSDDLEWSRVEVSPAVFGPIHRDGPLRATAVVFPEYRAPGETTLTKVDNAAEVVERLASCCYDLDRLGLPGFELLVDMAASCPAWHLKYGDLTAAATLFGEACATAALSVRHITPTDDSSPTPVASVRRTPTAHAWAFGDGSTVVFDPPTRKITRLDPAGTEVWDLLSQPIEVTHLLELASHHDEAAVAGLRSWLQVMVSTGLVSAGEGCEASPTIDASSNGNDNG